MYFLYIVIYKLSIIGKKYIFIIYNYYYNLTICISNLAII